MATRSQVAALGYDVSLASPAYGDGPDTVPATFRVTGYGLSIIVGANDHDVWDSLADPAAHAVRVDQFENGLPEPEPVVAGPTAVQVSVAAALNALPNGPITKAHLAGVISALLGE